jgi:hypothetical protein
VLPQGRRWFELSVARKPGTEGEAPRFVALSRDITERVQTLLEAQVRLRTAELALARDAAEASDRAKTAFLANMSHEIRTPMNAIQGMAYLLRRGGVTPDQAERLDKIDAAAQHLMAIVDDLLDITSIEAGLLVLETLPVGVPGLLADAGALMSARAAAKGLALHIADAPAMPPLTGDPARLQQALLNYLGNAIKFTEQGSITLRVGLQQETADAVLLRFEVADTGIGIPAQTLPRLFGAFEQADNSTTRRYGGTGLGLAITRRLATLMGGSAGATSVPGQGSTFWFTARLLRRAEAPSASPTGRDGAEEALRQRHGGKRVLVVDDEALNREVAQCQLEVVGLCVDIAADGREAVAMAAATRYAAILMDMQLPELDGLAATQAIRRLPGGAGLPVIAMTANAFAEDRERCLAAGMDDYLDKPINPERLYATLCRWLDADPR